jgi:DNA-directed RNA polymerase subunit RPC12/RpoP
MDIQCPKCGSHDLIAGKKGFSGKKAFAGAVLTGGIGILAGTIGSKNVELTCLKCGTKFKPGHDMDSIEVSRQRIAEKREISRQKGAEVAGKPGFWIFLAIVVIGFLFLIKSCVGS